MDIDYDRTLERAERDAQRPWKIAGGSLAALGVMASTAACAWWFAGAPQGGTPAATGTVVPSRAASAPATVPAERQSPAAGRHMDPAPAPSGSLKVHVSGAVAQPGVVDLPAGARIFDALRLAGGPTPEAALESVNLAEPVSDGQHVHLAAVGAVDPGGNVMALPPGPTAAPKGQGSVPGRRVNLNTATAEELAQLPKVGPALAQRIIEHRATVGRFTSVEDLDAVPGIGPKMLEALRGAADVK